MVETEIKILDKKQLVRQGAKLDFINAGVESIRIDMKANEKSINNLSERMVRVEESSKQAHKRLDDIKKGDVKE